MNDQTPYGLRERLTGHHITLRIIQERKIFVYSEELQFATKFGKRQPQQGGMLID